MIHSLAGGNLGNERYLDFALVEIIEGAFVASKAWYISRAGVNLGDEVLVSYRGLNVKAKVLRIDKNVSSYSSPIPVKSAKQIIKKF